MAPSDTFSAQGAQPRQDVIRWWWVRHAPVDSAGFCGWSDPEADLGDQAGVARLRSALPEEAALWSSDLRRAVQTAGALSRRTWTRLSPDERLREQNFGDWEGKNFADIGEEDADAFWRDPAGRRPPAGESFSDVCVRVREAIRSQLTAEGPSDLIAVTHAGVIRAAIAAALDLEPIRALQFEIAPLSLTRLDWVISARAWRVGAVNIQV